MEGLRVEGYSSLACRPVAVIRKKKETRVITRRVISIEKKGEGVALPGNFFLLATVSFMKDGCFIQRRERFEYV